MSARPSFYETLPSTSKSWPSMRLCLRLSPFYSATYWQQCIAHYLLTGIHSFHDGQLWHCHSRFSLSSWTMYWPTLCLLILHLTIQRSSLFFVLMFFGLPFFCGFPTKIPRAPHSVSNLSILFYHPIFFLAHPNFYQLCHRFTVHFCISKSPLFNLNTPENQHIFSWVLCTIFSTLSTVINIVDPFHSTIWSITGK